MNSVLELLPLVAFFIAYVTGGLYWATGVLMVASVILMVVHRWRTGKFKDLHVVTAIVVVVLGSATLLLHDKRFILWKPTILFGLLAIALLVSGFLGQRPLMQRMFQSVMPDGVALSRRGWQVLNAVWAGWFVVVAFANWYIAQNLSEKTWVHFHTYGVSVATMVFMIPQIFWLSSKTSQDATGQR
jgi:intracellular septation protein